MRRRKHDLWKVGVTITGLLLLTVLLAWVPAEASAAYERTSGVAGPSTATVAPQPLEDATVTALNKEKLTQEVQQLKEQDEPDLLGWLRTNASIFLSTLVVVIGGLIGLFRWLGDRRDAQDKELKDRQNEREKRAEERFQSVVAGLGDEKEGTKVGAAILLRTFLRPGYEQFYTQTFDLAVAHLRLPRNPHPPENPDVPLLLTSLSQALIVVFKEAFPLARSQNKGSPQSLDATGVQLDSGNLREADLQRAWMRRASLRDADLFSATLSGARLFKADLRQAWLWKADLREADLRGANLSETNLRETNFRGANLREADLICADLRDANLSHADLRDAHLDRTNFEDALDLNSTNLQGVKGLTKEQLAICHAKGAIIDEGPTTSSSTVTSLPPSQSNDAQPPSAPPTPDTNGSNAPSPMSGTE